MSMVEAETFFRQVSHILQQARFVQNSTDTSRYIHDSLHVAVTQDNRFNHLIERVTKLPDFITRAHIYTLREITPCDIFGCLSQFLYGVDDAAPNQERET